MPYNENNGKAVSGNLYQRFDEGLGINPPRLLYRLLILTVSAVLALV
jgi:hypothetical protein